MFMFAPTAAPVNPTDAVAAEIARLLAAEGSYHVAGHYFACTDLANRVRRETAERNVAMAARRAQWLATHPLTCTWCMQAVPTGVAVIDVAGEPICAGCVADYEATVFGVTMDAAPLDESDVSVIEVESGAEYAFGVGVTVGWADGYHDAEQITRAQMLGRAA